MAACPGCDHRALSHEQSLAQKRDWLARTLSPWCARLQPVRSVEEPLRWHYRDRVTLHARWQNGWQFGLLRRDELIPIPECPVHSPRVNAGVRLLMQHLPPVNDFALAYLVQAGGQMTLVLKQAAMPPLHWLTEEFKRALAQIGIEGLWLHLNPSAGRRILHKPGWHLLWGNPRSRDHNDCWYGPAAFQQLLPRLHNQALDTLDDFLAPGPGDAVIDLYCGIGTTLRRWTSRGASALGVELGGEALACASLNAPQADTLRGSCATRLPQIRAWAAQQTRAPLLYVNPPRTGLEAEIIHWIAEELHPPRLAYLSCSAGTLARDLTTLARAGYEVASLIPYDFFPQTRHVETLALLGITPDKRNEKSSTED